MIKQTVNESRFTDVLMSDEYAGWTYGATKALYEYYEQLSEDMGEDIELDPVVIRCEWNEYPSALECAKDYDEYMIEHFQNLASASENNETAREWLEERTHVIDVENIDTTANEYRTIRSVLVMVF